jgi:hypothetical protein
VRLWLSIVAYNLGNLWRRLTLPGGIEDWSLTSLQQRVVKTGGIGETRAVLLADTGGRPSDARTIRCDVATDRDAATSRELTTRDATGTKSLRPREQGIVREESTRNHLSCAANPGMAGHCSSFRPQMQLWPCKTAHEQYNSSDSELKKEIPV